MAFVARLYAHDRAIRFNTEIEATLRDPDWHARDVVVDNISETGLRISKVAALPVGAFVSVGISGVGTCPARVVREDADGYGCTLVQPLTERQLHAAMSAAPLTPLAFPVPVDAELTVQDDVPDGERKLPVVARLLVIGGLSATLWAAIFVTAAAIV